MINLLFSMVGPELDAAMEEGFSRIAQWVVLNQREDRLLVDAVGHPAAVGAAFQALDVLGRAPIVIGAWNEDGSPVEGYDFSLDAWLAVAPDEIDLTDPDNPAVSRPTAWSEIHRWAGWSEKQVT